MLKPKKAKAKFSEKKTISEKHAYAKAQRDKAAKVVRDATGDLPIVRNAAMDELRKADNALIKSQREAEKSTFNNSEYKKIKKGMQR